MEFTKWLHEWQDLAGAITGGLLGVVGALIVAREITNRERRSASRMLQKDLSGVREMVNNLTYGRKVLLGSLGDQLVRNLALNRIHLSHLFESQMSIILGSDTALAGLLGEFHQCYSSLEYYIGRIERARVVVAPDPMAEAEERARVPVVLQAADDYACAAMYLLMLEEMSLWQKTSERLRRKFCATAEDKKCDVLIDDLRAKLAQAP